MDTNKTAHSQLMPIASQEEEFYPEHPAREETPEYLATHRLLVDKQDAPCDICGVTKSTLEDPMKNPFGAKQLETHHKIQRELYDSLDWQKVSKDIPAITSQDSFKEYIDSPSNMRVLCDVHHRSMSRGIHHLITDDFIAEKYLLEGYVLDDTKANESADIQKDNLIVDKDIPEGERT